MPDLRSDFLTRPTPAMIEAMREAALARPSFGLREDRFVAALECEAAALLGKEDALFCPTCTQANQIAINLHVNTGEAIAAQSDAHVFTSEAGAYSALSGAVALEVPGVNGEISREQLAAVLKPASGLAPRVGLVVLENTHVRSGGCVLPESQMVQAFELAKRYQIASHLDGARLPNAAVVLGRTLAELSEYADSVALSLNKGLGAPLGAMLAGSRAFVEEAVRIRQRFGGGWRPAAIPAAAARIALQGWQEWIAQDHRQARWLAERLAEIPGVHIDLEQVQSNLLLVGLGDLDGSTLARRLAEQEVLVLPFARDRIRIAMYRDVTREELEAVISAFRKLAQIGGTST